MSDLIVFVCSVWPLLVAVLFLLFCLFLFVCFCWLLASALCPWSVACLAALSACFLVCFCSFLVCLFFVSLLVCVVGVFIRIQGTILLLWFLNCLSKKCFNYELNSRRTLIL